MVRHFAVDRLIDQIRHDRGVVSRCGSHEEQPHYGMSLAMEVEQMQEMIVLVHPDQEACRNLELSKVDASLVAAELELLWT